MKAGREMDAQVAVLMKWEGHHDLSYNDGDCWYSFCKICGDTAPENDEIFNWSWDDPPIPGCKGYPPYSTDIAAAWLVVEKMIADGWDVNIEHTNMNEVEGEPLEMAWAVYFNYFTDDPKDFKHGGAEIEDDDALPEAICKAALLTGG